MSPTVLDSASPRNTPASRPPWLDRPSGWVVTLAAVACLCAIPAALLNDRLDGFHLRLDDFVYIAESRDRPTLLAHLAMPHNAHVVPLFRLWTDALISLSGGLGGLLDVLGPASYAPLVLAMLAAGVLVARETSWPVLGGVAMAWLGVSSVLEPVVSWYSAGQALWAALAALAMLLALQGWRRHGSAWRLVVGALAASAAPLFWSGGYVAGVAGCAYLWADGRPSARRAAFVPLGVAVLTALIVLAVSGRRIAASANFHERAIGQAVHPLQGLLHASQAIPEVLILHNVGLDVATTAPQGVVLCLALAAAWAWTRGLPPRPNPLEAAGAIMAVGGFLLAYSARGYLPFDSLRALGWYHAIPQVGAVLFASGWVSGLRCGPSPVPGPLRTPKRRGLLAVLALSAVLYVLHKPRVEQTLLDDVPPMSESERKALPIRELHRLRARYLDSELAARQQRFLARLDGARDVALRLGIGRDAIRRTFGRINGPGMPEQLEHFDALDLLAIPDDGPERNPLRIHNALRDWLAVEPEPRPAWLKPGDPWPPPRARP